MTIPIIAATLLLFTQCLRQHRGPLAVLVDWLHHLRALWFWVTREVGPGVWERRDRYGVWLERARVGRV